MLSGYPYYLSGAINKYLEEGLIKSEYIFYKSIINWWSVRFTKPMINYEILADSQHYFKEIENSRHSFIESGHEQ